MKKEQLKKLYNESKKNLEDEYFSRIIEKQLQDVLSGLGFEVDCVKEVVNIGTKKKKIFVNTTTVLLKRGREFYMTRRINTLIDFIFSPNPDENNLFDIIYNRV